MVLEYATLSPLIALWWLGYIPLWIILTILIIGYCLPKWPLLSIMEYLFPTVIFRGRTDKKYVALTFDDVPYSATNEIITLLNQYNAKVTFFCILNEHSAVGARSLVDAVRSGHQLANHGSTNSIHALKSADELKDEITTCNTQIKAIYDEAKVSEPNIALYRPGCGAFTPTMLKVVKDLGYVLTLGSVYPQDSSVRLDFINYWYLVNKIEAGDIVILHDRNWTPGLLRLLLPWLKNNDYVCVTVDELMRP